MAGVKEKVQEGEKLLSGFIPDSIYWAFKTTAANRQEYMKEAILHAALLYIDAVPVVAEEETHD